MFPRNKITGVNGNRIRTVASGTTEGQAVHASRKDPTKVEASLSFGNNIGSMSSMSASIGYGSQYQYYMTGLLPADPQMGDTSALALFYRDAYMFDNVAGSAVDIQSSFPFSTYELRGLEDDELEIFNRALDQLNILEKMPEISNSYLVDGFFCASLVYDQRHKMFTNALVHDALQCTIQPSQFFNFMPEINVQTSGYTLRMLNSSEPHIQDYINTLPHNFRELLHSGSFSLNPATTLYVPRKGLNDRAYLSYLHRILPMYLIEKTMFRGTLIEAARRQRAMTHVTAGDDLWTPTGEELLALVSQFQAAEFDPLGGWVATRNAVSASDLRPGGDFWKWTDTADVLVPYKLRALGISEAFLSGDSSYNAQESAYSIFLETMNSYRLHLTNRIFISTLFPMIAVANGLYKPGAEQFKRGSVSQWLASAANRAGLKIPTIHWHKSLEAKGEDDTFDMLEKASEKGIPIPLKTWMAAAGIDSGGLERDLKDDMDLRKRLEAYTGKDTSHEGEDFGPEDEDNPDHAFASLINQQLTTQDIANLRNRRSLLGRDFGESASMVMTKSGTQKKYQYNERLKQRDINGQIAKIAAKAKKDPVYRAALAGANEQIFGTTTMSEGNKRRR